MHLLWFSAYICLMYRVLIGSCGTLCLASLKYVGSASCSTPCCIEVCIIGSALTLCFTRGVSSKLTRQFFSGLQLYDAEDDDGDDDDDDDGKFIFQGICEA